jgi:hypothetical protein
MRRTPFCAMVRMVCAMPTCRSTIVSGSIIKVGKLDEARIEARRDDFHHNVTIGDDANRPAAIAILVDDDDIPYMVSAHEARRLQDRGGAARADDLAVAEFSDRHCSPFPGRNLEPLRRDAAWPEAGDSCFHLQLDTIFSPHVMTQRKPASRWSCVNTHES